MKLHVLFARRRDDLVDIPEALGAVDDFTMEVNPEDMEDLRALAEADPDIESTAFVEVHLDQSAVDSIRKALRPDPVTVQGFVDVTRREDIRYVKLPEPANGNRTRLVIPGSIPYLLHPGGLSLPYFRADELPSASAEGIDEFRNQFTDLLDSGPRSSFIVSTAPGMNSTVQVLSWWATDTPITVQTAEYIKFQWNQDQSWRSAGISEIETFVMRRNQHLNRTEG